LSTPISHRVAIDGIDDAIRPLDAAAPCKHRLLRSCARAHASASREFGGKPHAQCRYRMRNADSDTAPSQTDRLRRCAVTAPEVRDFVG